MGQAATQPIPAARDEVKATVNATSLFVASEKGDHNEVKRLVGAGADVNTARSSDGWSPLFIASFYGHLEVVKTLIEAGANINQANQGGWSPLYTACSDGHLEVVKTLVEAGANINQVNKDGWSPLYTACSNGHLEVVKTLIEAGANINQANKDNATPLYEASQEGHHEVVQTLLGASADDSRSPLYAACFTGHLEVVKTLIEAGANINQGDKDGWSPLLIASFYGHLDVVKTLIEAGANINQANQISDKTRPFCDFLSKKIQWFWGDSQKSAFKEVKILTSSPVLALFDPSLATTVSADASSFGLGVVLMQAQQSGEPRPIANASRAMTPTELRYTQIEKEALALTRACEKFCNYLVGLKFHLFTDHKPLVLLLRTKYLDELPLRVQRFRLRLMQYCFTISHVPGKDMTISDALSRAPSAEATLYIK